MMINLNDMFVFSKVVEHGGIKGAADALGMVRSRVSRRIAELETSLGAQLIRRSTRHFTVTELGKEFNKHCLDMISEANAALEKVAQARGRPVGLVRISCPAMLAQHVIGPLLPLFMREYPEVRIAIETANREVGLEENFDLSIRIQHLPWEDSSLIARSLGIYQPLLLASPDLLERHGRPANPEDLVKLPTLSHSTRQGPHVWTLVSSDKMEIRVQHDPALSVDDFIVIRAAALQGQGVALLPLSLCANDVREGTLEHVLPDYQAPLTALQALFPSRQGMLPAVRAILDFLARHCFGDIEPASIAQHVGQGRREHTRFWLSMKSVDELLRHPSSGDVCDRLQEGAAEGPRGLRGVSARKNTAPRGRQSP
jgi:DNA-binding transcriptional LysR family regulator